jgi:fucose permease
MTRKNRFQLLYLILLTYFTTVFITYIPGVLLPFWKEDFALSNSVLGLLGATFFLAYGLTSLPQGYFLDRIGNKKFFLWASACLFAGSLIFAFFPVYRIGLISLFIIGLGLTAFQIVGNLLVKKIDDDPEKYSRNLTMAQIVQGLGGLTGGMIIGFLVNTLGWQWTSLYYIFAVMSVMLAVSALLIRIPESKPVAKSDTSKTKEDGYLKLLKSPVALMFALGIFVYVGIEHGVATWVSSYLIGTFDMVKTNAAKVVSLYWFVQSIGRFTGVFVLNRTRPSKALAIYAVGCILSLAVAVTAPTMSLAIVGFALVGFFTSIMFPTIFSLAINSFSPRQEGTVAGILCTAIIGGAVIPPLIGFLGDVTGYLGLGMLGLGILCFSYIMFVGIQVERKTEPDLVLEGEMVAGNVD